jgi:hypothetical protein
MVAYCLCPILLLISAWGFWQWYRASMPSNLFGIDTLYAVALFIVDPLVVTFFLATTAAQRLEYNRLSRSYQVRIDALQERLNAQEDFLHVIADNDPGAITIFDNLNRFWFVNNKSVLSLQRDMRDIIGQTAHKVMDYDQAKLLESRLKDVVATGKPLEALESKTDDSKTVHYKQTRFEKIPPFGQFEGGIIARSEDVTNLLAERERRESILRQVITTLVAVVDRRDPYAAGHSARVGQLSRVIAEEMVLNETEIEAAEISGSLMNFGKVLVPREILTKTTALAPDELQRVRDSMMTSADILANIDFLNPVVPTLKQILERYDGQGVPMGLRGDAILMTARIVTVANAYVALVSARAHRSGLALDEALKRIQAEAGAAYDPKVIQALANYIQNRGLKPDWLKHQAKT